MVSRWKNRDCNLALLGMGGITSWDIQGLNDKISFEAAQNYWMMEMRD